jgi:tRNA-splicing ligase RtcB
MGKSAIKSKHLKRMGFPESRGTLGLMTAVLDRHYPGRNLAQMEPELQALLDTPAAFTTHALWGEVAKRLLPPAEPLALSENKSAASLAIFGAECIDAGALDQMYTALRLPVSRAGALMPDAHSGYGLPIGGVLATENAVIPYGVGVDIGCRMCLSIYELPPDMLLHDKDKLSQALMDHTVFGAGGECAKNRRNDHDILSDERFGDLPMLKKLKDMAYKQLGTSGSGNHFVEFGKLEVVTAQLGDAVPPGAYLALLSHSGSRGLGATIANHYTALAMKQCPLPDKAKHLAWLPMDTDEGREYWLAMSLAGDYASACHDLIHRRMAAALRTRPLLRVENHHNFAWKEIHEGRELIVHRKGATPAGQGVLGIIPGSMATPGYLVAGRGQHTSLNSAAHGAGRQMSRSEAKNRITPKMLAQSLAEKGVTLMGGAVDEAPAAYKDIGQVMQAQVELVDVVGVFQPKLVRMA